MRISMIVLNYNDAELTIQYVQSIQAYTCIDRIIVVDNLSPDNSFVRLQQLISDKVDVIQAPKNGGYATGNNFGLRYLFNKYGCEGYVIISNPDIIVEEKSIRIICESFEDHPNQFAATGEIYNLSNQRIPLFIWKLPTAGMLFIQSSVILRKLTWMALKYGKRYPETTLCIIDGNYIGEVLPGCFFMADAKKLSHLGLFSESTFLYYEEEILFHRAKAAGFTSCVVPNEVIIHAEGASTKKSIRSWVKIERIMEDSCATYQKECLQKSKSCLSAYRIWNRLLMPERYFYANIKKYYHEKR